MESKKEVLTDTDLTDTPELCGGFVVWLSRQERGWLNGRYVKNCGSRYRAQLTVH